jgi:hypothetical protein
LGFGELVLKAIKLAGRWIASAADLAAKEGTANGEIWVPGKFAFKAKFFAVFTVELLKRDKL